MHVNKSLESVIIDKQVIKELFDKLKNVLGDNLVSVESFNGADGENVKIVVREKNWEVIDKIMEEIWRLETERNLEGKIIPSIDEE